MRDNMHDWVLANENMAKVLADKGYHYQFVFARNAVHVDRPAVHSRRFRKRWSTSGKTTDLRAPGTDPPQRTSRLRVANSSDYIFTGD